jgi:2-polyprenyl-3-methyl-5-hydroxy-6-metoxy-1,4-benzoquinol methylase
MTTSLFATCLLCASPDVRPVATNQSFGINIVQCKACGFVHSEYVSEWCLQQYYATYYRGSQDASGIETHRVKGAGQAASQMAYLRARIPGLTVRAALDYGTAEGSLAHQLTGVAAQVFVTEMDPQFVALLRAERALTLVDDAALREPRFHGFFDLACLSHVLEHLNDPYVALDLFATIVKPGGWLLVDIPNEVRLLAAGFQGKGHLSYFTTETFARFVEVQGMFDLREIRTVNREVDDFIASKFTLAEDYSIERARDGTVIRALLQCREPARRTPSRRHRFDQAALLNDYSARIMHYHHLLQAHATDKRQ